MKKIIIAALMLLSVLLGGLLTYFFFPGFFPHRQVEVTIPPQPCQCEICEVCEICEICQECEECPEQITPDCGTKPRMERHDAFVIEDGEKKKAGSNYKNEPSECAKLHDRSLC